MRSGAPVPLRQEDNLPHIGPQPAFPACDKARAGTLTCPKGGIIEPLIGDPKAVSFMAKLIAFQGAPGAFSHAASHAQFPEGEPVPCVTFEDTISAVQTGKADFGVVPVEYSLYGRITDIYQLLPSSGLFIIGEHFLRIEMNLLGVKGATLKDIKSVQSLTVALGQCRSFIRKHKLKTINGGDTAGSAREIAERGDKSVAAIASRFA